VGYIFLPIYMIHVCCLLDHSRVPTPKTRA